MPDGIHLLILCTALATFLLWEHEAALLSGAYKYLHAPVAYGVTLALLALLVPSITPDFPVSTWWISSLGFVALLLLLEYRILRVHQVESTAAAALSVFFGTALISLTLLAAPGILAACFLLILSFQRGNRILSGLAVVFLAIFLCAFYYHLNFSLLTKSIILLVSGTGLLGLRFVFTQRFKPSEENHA